jgi:hypothetical protein
MIMNLTLLPRMKTCSSCDTLPSWDPSTKLNLIRGQIRHLPWGKGREQRRGEVDMA